MDNDLNPEGIGALHVQRLELDPLAAHLGRGHLADHHLLLGSLVSKLQRFVVLQGFDIVIQVEVQLPPVEDKEVHKQWYRYVYKNVYIFM